MTHGGVPTQYVPRYKAGGSDAVRAQEDVNAFFASFGEPPADGQPVADGMSGAAPGDPTATASAMPQFSVPSTSAAPVDPATPMSPTAAVPPHGQAAPAPPATSGPGVPNIYAPQRSAPAPPASASPVPPANLAPAPSQDTVPLFNPHPPSRVGDAGSLFHAFPGGERTADARLHHGRSMSLDAPRASPTMMSAPVSPLRVQAAAQAHRASAMHPTASEDVPPATPPKPPRLDTGHGVAAANSGIPHSSSSSSLPAVPSQRPSISERSSNSPQSVQHIPVGPAAGATESITPTRLRKHDSAPSSARASFKSMLGGLVHSMSDVFVVPSKKPEISTPYDPVHLTHVGFNTLTGEFTGLPREWQILLQQSGISRQDQEKNPQAVMDIVAFYQDATQEAPPGSEHDHVWTKFNACLLYTSPSPRDRG